MDHLLVSVTLSFITFVHPTYIKSPHIYISITHMPHSPCPAAATTASLPSPPQCSSFSCFTRHSCAPHTSLPGRPASPLFFPLLPAACLRNLPSSQPVLSSTSCHRCPCPVSTPPLHSKQKDWYTEKNGKWKKYTAR